MKEKIVIHVCCGICALYPVKNLSENFEVIGFWYNPNIHPYKEYQIRLSTASYAFSILDKEIFFDYNYDITSWFEKIIPAEKEGKRCELCYRIRLEKTAEFTKTKDIKYFTTTLLVSPYQSKKLIKKVGEEVAEKFGLSFYYEDFSTGYREGREMARKYGMYHQNYCGCLFSEYERFSGKLTQKTEKM